MNELQKFKYWHKLQKLKLPKGCYTYTAKLNGDHLTEMDLDKMIELAAEGISVEILAKIYVVYPHIVRYILEI